MNKFFLLVLVIGISSCKDKDEFTTSVCLPANLQSGVIAFYPFVDGTLDDESSNTINLTNSTSAQSSTDRNGNSNCAYIFDNTTTNEEFITTSNTNFLNNLSEFSVSIWYEPLDTTRAPGSFEALLNRGDEGHCPNRLGEWSIGLFDCRRAVFGHDNSVWADVIANGCNDEISALTNKWHHVVATKNDNDYKIYFNGTLNETATGNGNCRNLHIAQDIGDMFIGSRYTGRIDDVIIYNKELSETEVTELYNLEPCCN